MAKVKKIESPQIDQFDLFSAAGVTLDTIEVEKGIQKLKDVKRTLCKYRDWVRVLRDEESVNHYIEQCVKNGIVALDTETDNSLNVHKAIMVGLCLYTPFNRPVYIPVMHLEKGVEVLVERQVSREFLKEKIMELMNLKIIYHNAKFDVNVIRNNYKIVLPVYWDTWIAAKALDENRKSSGLKTLYVDGIEPTQVSYHVTTFFDDNIHANIEDFGLYSGTDAYDTFKVYEWQYKELSSRSMAKLKSLLLDLEFRVTEVCADMEYNGITFNLRSCQNYIKTETERLNKLGEEIEKKLEPYKEQILNWKYVEGGRGKVRKLDEDGNPIPKMEKQVIHTKFGDRVKKVLVEGKFEEEDDPYAGKELPWPIKLTSADQVLCLLNCVMGLEIGSTTFDDLNKTGDPIAKLIAKYRHLNHNLTSFYIPYSNLQEEGKMYSSFMQMGGKADTGSKDEGDEAVKTGRFSCKDPNLEQLPARQQEDGVRMLFSASKDVPWEYETDGNLLRVFFRDKIETPAGFIEASKLRIGDTITTDLGFFPISTIQLDGEWLNLCLVTS